MKAPATGSPPLLRWFLPLLLAVSLARLWLMPMFSSFWVDEMGTAFVVRHGAGHPSLRVAPQVPQSIYYALPALGRKLGETSEFAWRLPSFLAVACALALVAILAARLVHPGAAWFAVFACLALRGFDYQAADARPYGLGTLLAAAALLSLVRWMDRVRWRDLAFLVAAALLWRVHLVFWPMYAVFVAYAAVRLAGRPRPEWIRAGLVFALLAAALVPVLFDALRIFRQAGAHVVMPPPGARDLAASLKLGLIAACAAGAWLVRLLSRTTARAAPLPRGALLLVIGWWLCQPLGLFAFSRLTGDSLFVPRYLALSLAGAALAATAAASRFLPESWWKPAAAVLGLAALLLNAQWGRAWPLHHNSDWRSAARAVSAWGGALTPVICPSPFVEARPPVWSPDYRLPGFLYSHLEFYPPAGRIYLFPFDSSPEARRYAESLSGQLEAAGRFLVYGGAGQAGYWRDWFSRRSPFARWTTLRLGPFADVEVYGFARADGNGTVAGNGTVPVPGTTDVNTRPPL